MSDYQVRDECAVCGNTSLQEVLNLNEVPLAGRSIGLRFNLSL